MCRTVGIQVQDGILLYQSGHECLDKRHVIVKRESDSDFALGNSDLKVGHPEKIETATPYAAAAAVGVPAVPTMAFAEAVAVMIVCTLRRSSMCVPSGVM